MKTGDGRRAVKASAAAVGLRAHSGWAALVAVAGGPGDLRVLDRRRVELGDPETAGPKQPYHEAEGEPLPKARRIVDRYAGDAFRRGAVSLRAALEDLRARGFEAVACALLTGSARPLPDLAAILRSHALIHTADGVLFRDALARAAADLRLALVTLPERELAVQAQASLGRPASDLQRRVSEAGRAFGPPWTQDQKLAALAAWVALTRV